MRSLLLLLATLVCGSAAAAAKVPKTQSLLSVSRGTTPPNTNDPDYSYPASRGGEVNKPGGNGMVVILAKAKEPTLLAGAAMTKTYDDIVLTSKYFFREEKMVQEYIVPGYAGKENSAPYGKREVRVKVWGGGGGGCGGGRWETTEPLPKIDAENDRIYYSQGSGGGYVETNLLLNIGDKLHVTIGGGGDTEGSQNDSLGGNGGYNGGYPGRDDGTSGGGGGGGMTVLESNGTVIVAAFGGDGGGNTSYCSAEGGEGGSLRGMSRDVGGYVNEEWVVDDDGLGDWSCPSVPYATVLTHDFASFTWNAGSNQHHQISKDLYVDRYIVYLSGHDVPRENNDSMCSEDYKLQDHVRRSLVNTNATTELRNLKANFSYCILVEAFSKDGISLGKQIHPFSTLAEPTNSWLRVKIRQFNIDDTLGYNANNKPSLCAFSKNIPTGRRGHSMAVFNDQVYIFGGATVKCICRSDSLDQEERCFSKNVLSNELWHMDPVTSEFSLLEPFPSTEAKTPRGREQHSMSVLPDGSMILIGGISTENEDLLVGEDSLVLGDVWMLSNPHRVISYTFDGINDIMNDMPVVLTPGTTSYHARQISLTSIDPEFEEDMCVKDIQVKISLELYCPRDLDYISLNSGSGQQKLFISSVQSRNKECNRSTINLTFSDDAKESVLSYSGLPMSGVFRPAGSFISAFGGMLVAGEWTLAIAQSESKDDEQNESSLLNWTLHIDAQPCRARAKWNKLETSSIIPPRRLHTTITVGDSIFVIGGYSNRRLYDLWRFDHDTLTWTELNAASMRKEWPLHGQSALLGPFGVLVYGGLEPGGPRHDLWLFDFIEVVWSSVSVAQNASVFHESASHHGLPYRYLSAMGLLTNTYLTYKMHNIEGMPGLLAITFGGDGGLLSNAHNDSKGFTPNSFFDDVWLLSLGGVNIKSPINKRGNKRHYCKWRLDPNSTAQKSWKRSCGWNAADEEPREECHWRDILTIAWCMDQYQSFQLS
ncbi:hypothetical protein HJC23_013655 [Cyclotella cryptica]|uniref:receptor protein-tyrosine kinase n=1 Tax=Cyclotella cryptica TaxID=29204 RepID=A0ABD3QWG4_9STRA|eukprot:CCRYP_001493-RA/>CCRYP_001493-RA protein AED:0.20 eAED:0.23 QI:0/0.33/0/1/1/1/4/0/988